jgi:hypothetical protein
MSRIGWTRSITKEHELESEQPADEMGASGTEEAEEL